uniref:glutathione transferase n=1 Tax=Eisenia fetida TaxID=6396 RepID=E9NPR7_EISFE|nr:glutathione S-transferase [Eisenia fetida]
MPYKLIYFPVRGRGQALRYLAVDNGLELQEEVVSDGAWSALKPKTPLGQLPVFQDGDLHLGQSNAILRYVARKHGLYGKNDREAALIDMINDQQEDIRQTYLHLIYQNYDAGKAAYIKNLPTQLAVLRKFLRKSRRRRILRWRQDQFCSLHHLSSAGQLEHPLPSHPGWASEAEAFHSRIASREKITKHRATDASKKLPINGNGKQ